MRPRAYLIVFTNNKYVKGAVAVNFGVYCYPCGGDSRPSNFLKNHGENYGFNTEQKVRVLTIETEG